VEDLRVLLKSQDLRPPYVLVGHSAGGLYVQLFARKYPGEVAGLVLVDSSHPEQGARSKAAQPAQYTSTRESWKQLPEPLRREADQFDRTGEEVLAAPPMPRVPAIVLSATQPAEGPGAEGRKFFLTLQADLVAHLPGAVQWLAPKSRHNIQRDEPELVVRAIRHVWDEANKQRP
jgi:pimeloyl-ACP methyl ester carboxylesterase